MTKIEKLNSILQTNKRTGEVKTARAPQYRGTYLHDVYGTYSIRKESAYNYCLHLLNEISDNVLSYGITSANGFKFTFAGVFETSGEKYVLICTADYDKIYLLEENENEN